METHGRTFQAKEERQFIQAVVLSLFLLIQIKVGTKYYKS